MLHSFLLLGLLCAVGSLPVAANGQGRVRVRDAASFALKDAHDGVTVAAEAYDAAQSEKIKEAFGKNDPREKGILPVYFVIANSTHDAIRLNDAEVTFETTLAGGRVRRKLHQMTGEDVNRRIRGIAAPNGIKAGKPKAPLSEIIDQEFLVKMIPPGDTVGGFLYFEDFTGVATNWTLLLNGVRWASSGKEMFFFEIHCEAKP